MSDDRLNMLGHAIWRRVMSLHAYEIARSELPRRYHGEHSGADYTKMIMDERMALWGDLQTLFRGGVFPEDMEPIDLPPAEIKPVVTKRWWGDPG